MVDNGVSRFGFNPDVNVSRTAQVIDNRHLTTLNTGVLVPIYVNSDILPGTTVSMDMSSLVRMSTPIFPVMDNCFLDLYWFFTPHRLVWDNFKNFFGESADADWESPQDYEIPQLCSSPSSSNTTTSNWTKGTIADYFGLPTDKPQCYVNALPFRAYCMIYNEWFRSTPIQKPLYFPKDDSTQYAFSQTDLDGNYDYISSTHKGLRPAKANRFFDYFSGCLPSPQVGSPVTIDLLGKAPVFAAEEPFDHVTEGLPISNIHFINSNPALYGVGLKNGSLVKLSGSVSEGNTDLDFVPDNLYADLSQTLVASVNELRLAFALQTLLERDSRGVRYRELLYNHFGVSNGDSTMQVPEFLDGCRIPINVDSIYATSETASRPQGSAAGFSLTTDTRSSFTKSFTEPGTLMCLAVVRTHHTYQQGLDKMWTKKRRFDHYYPVLANLGNQPVYTRELYFDQNVPADDVFGYQEAWAEYRFKRSFVSSEFRSNYAQSLDSWHYADFYSAPPVLDSAWMEETEVNVDRTLAVQSSLQDQFICDFYFKPTYVQPVPLYSVPGLNVQHY